MRIMVVRACIPPKRHIFMMSLDVLQTESDEVNAVVYLTFLTVPLV
jgi:hypothetical protein